METLHIAAAVLDEIVAHARADAPDECCGLLVGPEPPDGRPHGRRAIDRAVRATNLERGPTRYRIDPVEHLRLQKALRGTARTIAGAYHSHTRAPAVPSQTDLDEAFYPDFVYVIVSLADPNRPEVRGWRIVDATATEVALVPTG